jgi:hypothetical protein
VTQRGRAEGARARRAAGALALWIESHLHEFWPEHHAPPARAEALGSLPFRCIKPLGELALLTLALTHRRVAGDVASWAGRIAQRLWSVVAERQAAIPWSAQTLLLFPTLELATNRRFAFRERVEAHLAVVPVTLESQFAADLMGRGDCRALSQRSVREDLARGPTLGPLYGITHAVFFASRFGRRRFDADRELQNALCAAIAARLSTRELDIVAELVAALAWTGGAALPACRDGARALVLAAESEGSILGDPSAPAAPDDFRQRYHATIAGLAAIMANEGGS